MDQSSHSYYKPHFQTHLYCFNCHRYGHKDKTCPSPKNSYGCIIYRISSDQQIRYLMIQQKYTPEYIELLRGLYWQNDCPDYDYLATLVQHLSLIERNYILKHDFVHLWKNIWKWPGNQSQMIQNNPKMVTLERKFNAIKNGFQTISGDQISFQQLFDKFPTQQIEPEWGFPKGKRNAREGEQQCAIRETCEETSLQPTDFEIHLHVKPFQEIFTGDNNVSYCNNYYLAKLIALNKPIYFNPTHQLQNNEIRKIGWFTKQEIIQLIGYNQTKKLDIINQVETIINRLISISKND